MKDKKKYASWTLVTTSGYELCIESFVVTDATGSITHDPEHWCSIIDLETNKLVYPSFATNTMEHGIQTLQSLAEMLGRERTEKTIKGNMVN